MTRPVAAPKARAKLAGRRTGSGRVAPQGVERRQKPQQRSGIEARGDPLPALILNALEQTQAIIGIVDGRIVHWSRGDELLYGWTASEAIGRRAQDLLKQKNAAGSKAGAAKPARGAIRDGAVSRAHKDGRELAIAARCVSRCDFNGRAAIIELDDLIEPTGHAAPPASAPVRQSDADGDPTGRIVHDFNNLLGIITLNLELALTRERTTPGGELREMIEEALDAAWQSSELTGHLAAVARRRPLQPEPAERR
jgi:PAS domain S-box-containing protein